MNEFNFDVNQFIRKRFPCAKFKGSDTGNTPHAPVTRGAGKWAQQELYKVVQRALSGGGLLPFDKFGPLKGAYQKAQAETKPFLQSYLNRMVPQQDATVRNYANRMFDRDYYSGLQDLREQEKLSPYQDQQEAMGMGMQYLAGEKQMSANILDIYNQAKLQQSQMPTFGSQLGYGLSQAGGILAAQRYAQIMNEKGAG